MKLDIRNLKVALVHDYLNQYGGAERVLESFHHLFPQAPVYTLLYDQDSLPEYYKSWDIRPSFLNRIPGHRKHYQKMLPLFPLAIESFDLSGYDIVISSSNAWAKGVITSIRTFHLCYIHTPMRFAWDWYHNVFGEHGLVTNLMLMPALNRIRMWDVASSFRPDCIVANSNEVKKRIAKYYHRGSDVVYPPVDTNYFSPLGDQATEEYYLVVSRLKPYKRVDVAIEAFNNNGLPLVIVGHGSECARLKNKAGSNIRFTGYVSDQELLGYYRKCRALVFTALEDFGIAPLEAQSCGRPVISFGRGGCLETVINRQTGILFEEQTAESLNEAIDEFKKTVFDSDFIVRHAKKFDKRIFHNNIMRHLADKYCQFLGGGNTP